MTELAFQLFTISLVTSCADSTLLNCVARWALDNIPAFLISNLELPSRTEQRFHLVVWLSPTHYTPHLKIALPINLSPANKNIVGFHWTNWYGPKYVPSQDSAQLEEIKLGYSVVLQWGRRGWGFWPRKKIIRQWQEIILRLCRNGGKGLVKMGKHWMSWVPTLNRTQFGKVISTSTSPCRKVLKSKSSVCHRNVNMPTAFKLGAITVARI